ncbi:MAG: LamG-like jellyroll fold domain-containing protein [Bacteroidota bacterium]
MTRCQKYPGQGCKWGILVLAMVAVASVCTGQQITINRIESMPNKPFPYAMRDWKNVARGYDSLVFNPDSKGTYLPLVSVSQGFGLSSYVGRSPSQSREAINCLAAVVGASLVGVDKSNQYGSNWVLLCQDWFNQNPQESVYLNNPGASSGSDWWYDMMPNVFFYQLYSMYPNVGDFQHQFMTVADRWLAALKAMGASTAPWGLANVDHRAWYLSTMTPNNASVHEPEAAGAIAWILYNAFVQTGNTKYRIGAELAMESLLVYPVAANPSYELQLPFGAYVAARMNAEVGTTYDIAKTVGWCFSDGSDNPRLWGVTTGKWGGCDCYGLIGETSEATGNGYAFIMNTFEQVGALVPLVRYDERYARAIGKWVLNAANAARLFYTNYLPDQNQDGAEWSHQYDPESYIAHEAMRQYNLAHNAITPYATGDAIQNGNPTNFALYGSSHVGIFGGIIDTTNVPMILRLDVLKTDYFHSTAYPTFLYFNPDLVQHAVNFDAGSGQRDLYDAVSHSFLKQGVTGVISLPINANSAVLVVNAPAGGKTTYDLDRMLIDGVVVDYHSDQVVEDYPPRIKSLAPDSSTILTKHAIRIYCTATDKDNDVLAYSWSGSGGTILGSGSVVNWLAPDSVGTYVVTCTVTDVHGAQAISADTFNVVKSINNPPVILKLNAVPRKINIGARTTLGCLAVDPDSNALSYRWSAQNGSLTGSGSFVSWQSPSQEGNYFIFCTVDDGVGGMVTSSIELEVRDFSKVQSGKLVAFYPFNGDAKDGSGFHHDGRINGGSFVGDRFGRPSSAFALDGVSTSIAIPNDSTLNFQNEITVNFWMIVRAFYDREQYPISHGNWQNRWKVSISNKHLRWTIKTPTGTKDLDSETELSLDSLYNVTVCYNGADIEVYLNGALDAFSSWSGAMLRTSYDLTIGQDLPGDNNYNFKGVLDDIRIFDYAASVQQIANLFDINTAIAVTHDPGVPRSFELYQNYPNPFNPTTAIGFQLPAPSKAEGSAVGFVSLRVYDVLGREVKTLVNGIGQAGAYSVQWDGKNERGEAVSSGIYLYQLRAGNFVVTRKMLFVK